MSSKFLISCINMSGRFLRCVTSSSENAEHSNMVAVHNAYEKSGKEHKEALCSVWKQWNGRQGGMD
jgi:hypothetical protein